MPPMLKKGETRDLGVDESPCPVSEATDMMCERPLEPLVSIPEETETGSETGKSPYIPLGQPSPKTPLSQVHPAHKAQVVSPPQTPPPPPAHEAETMPGAAAQPEPVAPQALQPQPAVAKPPTTPGGVRKSELRG